jgi:hypothetical protein
VVPIPDIFGKTSRTDVLKRLPVRFINWGDILYNWTSNGS